MQVLYLEGERIEYSVERSVRAKRLRLTVHVGGHLVVTVPVRATLDTVESLIRTHATWIARQCMKQRFREVKLLPAMSDQRAYREQKAMALSLVQELIQDLGGRFPIHTVSIKNHRTRWGSCSKRGNLNFNYRIIFLPRDLARYIVIHELCHLREMNHSRAFWNHVAQFVPDFISERARLRRYVWKKV